MVYFLNLDGTMTLAEPQRVFQGSNNVNTVYVLSAIAPPTALEISFTLPSGLTTAYYPMIYNGATDEYTVPNTTTTVYLRSFLLTSNITAEVGTVGVSVNAVYSNADGTTGNQTSFTGSFNVEYSSIPETVTTGAADELQQALDLLSQYYTQQQAIITGGTNGEYLQSQGNNQLPVWTSFDMDFVTVNRAQSFSEEQKTQARKNIGAASQTSLDNDIANCVQIKAQSLTNEQKAQARTNIDVYSKNEIDDSVVKYSSPQSLTDTQKAQARTNIGAEGSADSQYTVKVIEQIFTEEQKAQARTNIGAEGSADSQYTVKVVEQIFTEEQKAQARTNIGAEGSADSQYTVKVVEQTFTEEQKAQARTNIGAASQTSLDNDIANLTSNTTLIQNSDGGFSAGNGATATRGGAVGNAASAEYGGAVGNIASATTGGAVGYIASATTGGAVGDGAKAGDGFSGGHNAQVVKDSGGNYIDAIQLGTGTNNTPRTLQVYNHKVYNSTNDSLYCSYINDKTPAVIETVWSGTLKNDGTTSITIPNVATYDYFILYGTMSGRFCNIIANIDGVYSFTKKSETSSSIMLYDFSLTAGSLTWGVTGYYESGNFTFVDRTGTSFYDLFKVEGVKICKA